MKYLKKFELFKEGSTETAPVKPGIKTDPGTKPGKPMTRPSKPGPIPNKDPNTIPSPAKAEKKKATAEEVAERFISLMVDKHEDVKKYTEL